MAVAVGNGVSVGVAVGGTASIVCVMLATTVSIARALTSFMSMVEVAEAGAQAFKNTTINRTKAFLFTSYLSCFYGTSTGFRMR